MVEMLERSAPRRPVTAGTGDLGARHAGCDWDLGDPAKTAVVDRFPAMSAYGFGSGTRGEFNLTGVGSRWLGR